MKSCLQDIIKRAIEKILHINWFSSHSPQKHIYSAIPGRLFNFFCTIV
jgi:hypothetical protein